MYSQQITHRITNKCVDKKVGNLLEVGINTRPVRLGKVGEQC